MAISAAECRWLTLWGHRVAVPNRMWSEEERREALEMFSATYHLAETDADRWTILTEFHEGYRQHHNVSERYCETLVLPREEVSHLI